MCVNPCSTNVIFLNVKCTYFDYVFNDIKCVIIIHKCCSHQDFFTQSLKKNE